jgi:hypothetical protein
MLPMLRPGLTLLLVAWVALLLPWERCHGACHDRVHPDVAGHDCHGPNCPEDSDENSEHQKADFVSLKPSVEASKAPLPAFVHPLVTVAAPEPVAVLSVPASPDPVPPSPRMGVVLLL